MDGLASFLMILVEKDWKPKTISAYSKYLFNINTLILLCGHF